MDVILWNYVGHLRVFEVILAGTVDVIISLAPWMSSQSHYGQRSYPGGHLGVMKVILEFERTSLSPVMSHKIIFLLTSNHYL